MISVKNFSLNFLRDFTEARQQNWPPTHSPFAEVMIPQERLFKDLSAEKCTCLYASRLVLRKLDEAEPAKMQIISLNFSTLHRIKNK